MYKGRKDGGGGGGGGGGRGRKKTFRIPVETCDGNKI